MDFTIIIVILPLEEAFSMKHKVNSKHTVSTHVICMLNLDTPETGIFFCFTNLNYLER